MNKRGRLLVRKYNIRVFTFDYFRVMVAFAIGFNALYKISLFVFN